MRYFKNPILLDPLDRASRRAGGKTVPNLELVTQHQYRGADNSLARPTSRCILFDG